MAVSGSAPGVKSRSALDRRRKRCGTFSRRPRATATAIRLSPKLWAGRSGRRGKTTATAWGVRPWTAEMGVTEQTRSFRTTDAIRRWTDIEVTAIERACHQLDRRMAERGEDRDAISGTVAGMRREWRGGALLRALVERGIAGVQGSPEADAVPYPGNLTAFVPPRIPGFNPLWRKCLSRWSSVGSVLRSGPRPHASTHLPAWRSPGHHPAVAGPDTALDSGMPQA